jgi:peptidoglycan/LPS O-acetylase OafA/YrhL
MWFCAALLVFSIIYGLIRLTGWRETRLELHDMCGAGAALAAFVAVMAISTFLVRVLLTEETTVLNVHPGDFPQYVLMFAAGAFGYRGAWITTLPERFAMRWGAFALAFAVPLFAGLILFGGGLRGETALYAGGFNPVSAGKCLWEALVCVAMGILMLAVYRRHFDRQGPVARWLSDNAFGVYLIHPPILIGAALLLHGLAWNAVAKALLLTVVAALGSFAVAAFVVRKSPLRAIV